MQISDIVNDIYKKTKTNSTSYVAADMLIDINNAYNRVSELILVNDRKWQFEDTNNTDLPIATAALVASQQDYSLTAAFLTVDRVEVLANGGSAASGWTELTQIDQQQLKKGRQIALTSYKSTAGTPTEYDLVGNSIFLYPPPSYSQAASLKIYFTRGPSEFTSADVSTGTKTPGFNSLFHQLISFYVAYDYCITNIPAIAGGYLNRIQLMEQQIVDFYGMRDRDIRGGFTIATNQNMIGNISGQLGTSGNDSNK